MRNTVSLPTESLKTFEDNPKHHPEEQIEALKKSIQQFGFTNPILVDEDNMILGGHGRLMAAKSLGMTEVECLVVPGLTPNQKKAYVIADNKLTSLGDWDEDRLSLLIKSFKEDEDLLSSLGFSETEIEYLTYEDTLLTMPCMEDELEDVPKKVMDLVEAPPLKRELTKYCIILEFTESSERSEAFKELKHWQDIYKSLSLKSSNY